MYRSNRSTNSRHSELNTLDLQKGIIYGPVLSRRLGRSLGVNLLPVTFKLCSLNCSYCQYSWTSELSNNGRDFRQYLPSVKEIEIAIKQAFTQKDDFDYLTFSGNGEPTLHPDFPEIVDLCQKIKSEYSPEVKLAILSNSTTCWKPRIRAALEKIDLAMMKLDAGNEYIFKKLNHGKPPITLERIVAGIKGLTKYVIQSMFVQGAVNNSSDFEVQSWLDRLKELNPLSVQIYSIDRGTASETLQKVELHRLNEIAALVKKTMRVKVEVY